MTENRPNNFIPVNEIPVLWNQRTLATKNSKHTDYLTNVGNVIVFHAQRTVPDADWENLLNVVTIPKVRTLYRGKAAIRQYIAPNIGPIASNLRVGLNADLVKYTSLYFFFHYFQDKLKSERIPERRALLNAELPKIEDGLEKVKSHMFDDQPSEEVENLLRILRKLISERGKINYLRRRKHVFDLLSRKEIDKAAKVFPETNATTM